MLTQLRRRALYLALPWLSFGVLSAHGAERHELAEICGDCRVEKFATCGGFLEGATVDRSGTLWAVDLLSGNVLRVDDGGQCHVEGTTGGAPNGAKFHRDGRLFIADKNLGVLAFDPATGALTTIADTYRAERIRGTNDLVFDADGGLYFTEPYGSNALDPDGRVVLSAAGRQRGTHGRRERARIPERHRALGRRGHPR